MLVLKTIFHFCRQAAIFQNERDDYVIIILRKSLQTKIP